MRASALVGAALLAILVIAPAAPAQADDYPSWAEVQAAKANAAAAAAEVQKIDAAVAQVQAKANAAAAAELTAASAYTAAESALQAATAKLSTITDQVTSAKSDAAQAKQQFGRFIAQLGTISGGELTTRLLLSPGSHGHLLDELQSLSQLSRRTSQLQAYALQKQNLVVSLQAQAKKAEQLRATAEADADTKLQAAQAAQAAAQTELAADEAESQTLYAEAASLKNTAASEQAQYYQGIEAGQNGGGSDMDLDISGVVADPAGAQAYARGAIGAYGWGSDQFGCLVQLWNIESGWRANAYNRSSGAYGIPQALPANKMLSAGDDWLTNGDTQIDWGLSYIRGRYGSPCAALSFELSHTPHWY